MTSIGILMILCYFTPLIAMIATTVVESYKRKKLWNKKRIKNGKELQEKFLNNTDDTFIDMDTGEELTKRQEEERERYINGEKQIKKHREVSKEDNKETSKIILNHILSNDLIDLMEEDRREKPAKNLKSKFWEEVPMNEENKNNKEE